MKQLIMTLVALIAVTTGAWAQGKLIYEKDFSSDAFYPFYLDAADQTGASATVTDGLLVLTNPKVQATNWDVQPEIGRLTSAAPTTQGNTYRVVMQYKTTVAGSVTFALGAQDWSNADWSGQTITVSNDFQTCEAYFNNYPYSNSESHILLQFGELVGTITIKKVEVYELYPFPITWDTTTKTATIAEMPASNVIVTPEYYPQATLATAPTAADGAKATTDDLLVSGGTVATITGSDPAAPQGTLMYYVSTSTMTTEALLALDADKWVTEPTAAGITQKCGAFVYYYVKGNDSTDDALNFSDGDISSANVLNVPIYPAPLWNAEFDLTNAPEEDKAGKWSTDIPEGGVVKGTPVTVTYTGTRKVIGVKAEKKSAFTPLDNTTTAWTAGPYAVPAGGLTYSDAITVSGDVTLVLTDGETLTLNKGISLASGATLTIQGNGTMNVNGTNESTASTVAGSGTITLTSGTLTAKGGNGGSVGDDGFEDHGGNGGDAINGSVIVSGGTLTARGGNGGSVGGFGYDCSGGKGGDAISGTLTINGGSTSVNNGSNGSIGPECDYCTAGSGGKAVAGAVTDNRS